MDGSGIVFPPSKTLKNPLEYIGSYFGGRSSFLILPSVRCYMGGSRDE